MPDSPVTPSQLRALISDPTASLCGNFVATLLKLPVLIYQIFNSWLDADGNFTAAFKKSVADVTIRPGDYIFSGAPLDETGRLLCDGREVSRTTYADLYSAIALIYGTPTSALVFKLPDFSDKFPRGVSSGVGATGGSEEATLDLTNVPPHVHKINVETSDVTETETAGTLRASGVSRWDSADLSTQVASTKSAGGSGSPAAAQPFSVLNPYIAVYIYIKT